MNIGYELVNSILQEGKLNEVIEAGFNKSWLNGIGTGSEVIFAGADKRAYSWILSHFSKHRKIPPVEIFREHFPDITYPLKEPITVAELIDFATEKVNNYLLAQLIAKVIDFHDEGKITEAVSLIRSEGSRIGTDIRYRPAKADSLNDESFDIDEFLNRKLEMGIPFGIPSVDKSFYGFQQGQLISLLGRQKSGKTTFTLNSALQAWRAGYTVLFYSVEMDVDVLRQKLLAMGAGVGTTRMRRGELHEDEFKRVRKFHDELTNPEETNQFLISKKKALITLDDIYAEVAEFEPNIVYIDGFNFMVDRRTQKMTDDWQANENVAAELKSLALEGELTVFVNTQVQEKQYNRKFGIEPRTIAGGTGLLKASDLVIGLDKNVAEHTVSCVMSRYDFFNNTVVTIDWQKMTFAELYSLEDKGI